MTPVLFVYAKGGPPLEYAVPRIAAHAAVHVLALAPLPRTTEPVWRPECASVTTAPPGEGAELVDLICSHARRVGAEAVLTLSEYAVVAVAHASLRLGLRGAGERVAGARDKRLMRRIWRDAGLPVPGFAEVHTPQDIKAAFDTLTPPLLLKAAWSAGSTAHLTVWNEQQAAAAWKTGRRVMEASSAQGYAELHAADEGVSDFLLEEIVTGEASDWFEGDGWGDYASVEGIVADGHYHPLCITGRMPTIAPFTERASLAPAALPTALQHRIEEVSRAAVDALGLDTCATHTEIKLGPAGAMWLIETAARFGGVMTTRQVETVFGLDMIGMLVRQLLGREVGYPEKMLTEGKGAAGSLVILAADPEGRPWTERPAWDFDAVDWPALVAPGSRVELVREHSLAPGSPIPPYEEAGGANSMAALCFLTAESAPQLLADCGRILAALPHALTADPAPRGAAVDTLLTLPLFEQLAGMLGGHPYVKVVVDRDQGRWHVLDSSVHSFHVNYIATEIQGLSLDQLDAELDRFNHDVYQDPARRFLLGVLSLHSRGGPERDEPFMVLETTEADTMGADLLTEFHAFVRAHLDPALELLVKPANHAQESALAAVPETVVPRARGHALLATTPFVPLTLASATGRLRAFASREEYLAARADLTWYDIVAMPVVPDDIPRLAGLINSQPTTPLSHTNMLAAGWGIPNAIVRGVLDTIADEKLDGSWVRYEVTADGYVIEPAPQPPDLAEPTWHTQRVRLDTPHVTDVPLVPLSALRAGDRNRYGTKAANLGELHHVLRHGSSRLTGYYGVPRPPRADLLGHLAARLGMPEDGDLAQYASEFLTRHVQAPAGIAVPFSVQQRFLDSSPAVQQSIGKLKMALELNSMDAVDTLCLQLQHVVRTLPVPEDLVRALDTQLVEHLTGTGRFAVRSSSNAEDLPGFSAAGIYESHTKVTDLPGVLDAIRRVWASLLSPRSVRLRHQAGISLDDTYMGVIVQRYEPSPLGGVMVTCNPTNRADFRNVYLNCAHGSTADVVDGRTMPLQYLYNTVEGGGRTVSLGAATEDLPQDTRAHLGRLALAGRLLQSHFATDYTFAGPLDIEWLLGPGGALHILQLRPYSA
ncbi:PEP/pyruvate-binding domain-containing protein [Streptomyces sp. NPDC016562]|uniref:PEP/pyruvate-binding domain-containing protein n=1 Tax=Streptomyces sp. NPDC016562 TaxID=3364966 RepID=UPI0036FC4A6C